MVPEALQFLVQSSQTVPYEAHQLLALIALPKEEKQMFRNGKFGGFQLKKDKLLFGDLGRTTEMRRRGTNERVTKIHFLD
ncbi:hypothetical protein GOBAR_DD24899 [Gossypium barbadense]|nr:hypothetical protein GOBAR_DD24899 [Gossypium barbadense]